RISAGRISVGRRSCLSATMGGVSGLYSRRGLHVVRSFGGGDVGRAIGGGDVRRSFGGAAWSGIGDLEKPVQDRTLSSSPFTSSQPTGRLSRSKQVISQTGPATLPRRIS